ncbi:MAG: helix-turn-helix transcriptional regulator [Rhodobacteraceae bacterium]|nr:helix-turn-helix transcriptional regulator [Paracoccaceae bacterium]
MEINNLYSQFCPVSMASEVICTRWTPLVLRELLCGSTRFNDLRRGVPKMSPTLLSKRLKELELAGVVRIVRGAGGNTEYHLTEAGEDLRPLVLGIGEWGQRWVESRLSLRNLDPSLLMWDIRRNLDPEPRPELRCTVQFQYPALAKPMQDWWLVIEKDAVDLCKIDPGFEVDLLITAELRAMTAIWMGLTTLAEEISRGTVRIDGPPVLQKRIRDWLKLSPFANVARRAV